MRTYTVFRTALEGEENLKLLRGMNAVKCFRAIVRVRMELEPL